jgi:hypothetical protein
MAALRAMRKKWWKVLFFNPPQEFINIL